jgi:hypothetical protein
LDPLDGKAFVSLLLTFFFRRFFYSADGGSTFLRKLGIHKNLHGATFQMMGFLRTHRGENLKLYKAKDIRNRNRNIPA